MEHSLFDHYRIDKSHALVPETEAWSCLRTSGVRSSAAGEPFKLEASYIHLGGGHISASFGYGTKEMRPAPVPVVPPEAFGFRFGQDSTFGRELANALTFPSELSLKCVVLILSSELYSRAQGVPYGQLLAEYHSIENIAIAPAHRVVNHTLRAKRVGLERLLVAEREENGLCLTLYEKDGEARQCVLYQHPTRQVDPSTGEHIYRRNDWRSNSTADWEPVALPSWDAGAKQVLTELAAQWGPIDRIALWKSDSDEALEALLRGTGFYRSDTEEFLRVSPTAEARWLLEDELKVLLRTEKQNPKKHHRTGGTHKTGSIFDL